MEESLPTSTIISKDNLTVINSDTAAYHHPNETIICHLTPLDAATLAEATLRFDLPNHHRLEYYYGHTDTWMVTEAINSKSLSETLTIISMNPELIWKRLVQVAEGMQYLHSQNIIHGALNTNSIFFRYRNSGCEAFLSNFSMATIVSTDSEKKADDIYDFGTLVWKALHPDADATTKEFNSTLPTSISEIAKSCWHEDISTRPSFDDEFLNRLRSVTFQTVAEEPARGYCIIV